MSSSSLLADFLTAYGPRSTVHTVTMTISIPYLALGLRMRCCALLSPLMRCPRQPSARVVCTYSSSHAAPCYCCSQLWDPCGTAVGTGWLRRPRPNLGARLPHAGAGEVG